MWTNSYSFSIYPTDITCRVVGSLLLFFHCHLSAKKLFNFSFLLSGFSAVSCELHIRDHGAGGLWPIGPHSWHLWQTHDLDACRCESTCGGQILYKPVDKKRSFFRPVLKLWNILHHVVLFVSGCLGRECALFKATQTSAERDWQVLICMPRRCILKHFACTW